MPRGKEFKLAKKKKTRGWRLPLRGILPVLLAAFAFLLDTSILPLFCQSVLVPNFTMALILAYSICRSSVMGFAYGVTLGLLTDITTSSPVGLYTATYLFAVLFVSMCSFFEKPTGKIVVVTILYLLQEFVFLMIAYASTIRLEWGYLIPMGIRIVISVALCFLLQIPAGRILRPRGVEYTRSRRK